MEVYRIAQLRLRNFQRAFDKTADTNGAVQAQRLVRPAQKRAAAEQAGQAEDVVAVQVRDENPPDFTRPDVGTQDLVLRGFAAIKQPDFVIFPARFQGGTGNVARFRRRTRAGA